MSVWKKASKINQKVHRERSQPEARRKLGFLEKHGDYKKRADNVNNQKKVLKTLHKRALNRNPDEFYHHMINSKLHNGVHHEREVRKEDTPEQIQLMQSQDLKYINLKRMQELKKIERLQAQLHLSSINKKSKNTHRYFKKNLEGNAKERDTQFLTSVILPDVDVETLKVVTKKRKQAYMELAKRIEREQQLSVVHEKLHIKKELANKKNILKPKIMKRGTTNSAPVYKWKYERKS